MMHWTWTAQVFLTLHTLVFLMKMHSYAFYNGHLSETQRRLASLDKPGLVSVDTAVRYPDPAPSGHPTHQHSNHARSKSVEEVREDLASELTSPLGCVTYPQNLSLTNYIDYIFCPTLSHGGCQEGNCLKDCDETHLVDMLMIGIIRWSSFSHCLLCGLIVLNEVGSSPLYEFDIR